MSGGYLLLPWLTPILLLLLVTRWQRFWWAAAATLPAITIALLGVENASLSLNWLLLGAHFALDGMTRLFLLYSGLLWLAAALYCQLRPTLATQRLGFRVGFLLAMSGNLLLILAADMLSFYLGFALMGLSAYAMVIAPGTAEAIQAGRRYLVWTVIGELALFSGMVMLAVQSSGTLLAELTEAQPTLAASLLILAGFGVKMALPGLHFWLPATYRAAPAAAAAVLSGPMLAAGLLGWLRFFPHDMPAEWGMAVTSLGLLGVALGLAGGALQASPRGVLAWSSIAKAGSMTAILGAAWLLPAAHAALISALILFALHHALIKSALFLGMGELESQGNTPWLIGGFALLALSLAGFPWLGGAAAKGMLSTALGDSGLPYDWVMAAIATGTAMLMARFVWLSHAVARADRPLDSAAFGWLALVACAAWLPFAPFDGGFSIGTLIALLLGLLLFYLTRKLRVKEGATPVRLPSPLALVAGYIEAMNALQDKIAATQSQWRASADTLVPRIQNLAGSGVIRALMWLSLFAAIFALLIAY